MKMQLKAMVIVFLIYILQFTGCGGDSSTAAGVIVATPAATSTPAGSSEQTSVPVATATPAIEPTVAATATPTSYSVPVTTSPGSPSTTTDTSSSSSIPVPDGYNMLTPAISGGNLDLSWSNISSYKEACLVLIYHSETPSDTANPISINCTFDNPSNRASGLNSDFATSVHKNCSTLRRASNSSGEYYTNHLEKLRKDFDFLKHMTEQNRYPLTLTSAELMARGKADRAGNLISSSVGDSKSFYITYSSTTQKKSFRCYAAGTHCYVYSDTESSDKYQDVTSYATRVADYFDNTIYSLVHNYIGSEWSPGIDGDSRIYIVLAPGMNNAYFSFTDEYKQSAIPSGEYSNEVEAIYVDPLLFSSASEKADSKIEVIESVIAHEFTHMVRFNMKFVGSNQSPGYNTMAAYYSTEIPVHEGTAQFVENVLLHRGITDNYSSIASMRASGLELYLEMPEICTLTSGEFNYNNGTGGLGIYEMGFFIVQYLYEKYGYDAISKLNKADGKLGIDSFYAATGTRGDFETAFDKQALSLLLSGKVTDGNYTINGVDLSGGTNYGGTMLHHAWSAFASAGDYDRGIDVSTLNNGRGSSKLYEWSPVYYKFFNMSGSLNINITGLKTGTGGGDIKAYFIYK